MKKIWLVLLALSCFALMLVHAAEVSSVNVVGYKKVTLPAGGFMMVAMNFDAFDQTLYGVLGTNQLIPGGGLGSGSADKVYIWNGTDGYDIYALKNTDWQYHHTSDWGGDPTNPAIEAGSAFWIKSADVSPKDITFMGEVVIASTNTVVIPEGWSMLGYGFSSGIALQDTSFAQTNIVKGGGLGSGSADKLYVWNGSNGYLIYAVKNTDDKWYSTSDWGGDPVSNVIEMGQGFWFMRQGAAGDLVWVETNKYLGNLSD